MRDEIRTPKPAPEAPSTVLPWLADDERTKSPWLWTLGLAVLFHALLLALHLPSAQAAPEPDPELVVRVPLTRIAVAPPPPPEEPPPPREPRAERRPMPVPDAPTPVPVRQTPVLTTSLEPVELDLEISTPLELPATAPPDLDEPRRLGGDIVPPEPLERPRPLYTEVARKARIQGVVVLDTVIGRDGRVRDMTLLKGLPLGLDQAALDAVGRWRYRPATLGGRPVAVRMSVSVTFGLS